MSILSEIFGGAASVATGGATTVVSSVLSGVTDIAKRFVPDPEAQARMETEVRGWYASNNTLQAAINLADANSGSFWRGGWRPALGWTCVACCAMNWFVIPMAQNLAIALGHPAMVFKPLDSEDMQIVLYGMLGLSGIRTVDKLGGKA
jgi:hypothetical protein